MSDGPLVNELLDDLCAARHARDDFYERWRDAERRLRLVLIVSGCASAVTLLLMLVAAARQG